MKIKNLLAALISLAFYAGAQNGAYIEYKITSSRGANGSAKINISEFGSSSVFNMVVPQMPGGGMTFKSLTQKNNPDVVYMINDNGKTYSEKKKDDMAKEDNKVYVVKKLGEEVVSGYKCVHAQITEGAETHETWNTKDFPDYAKYSESFRSNKKLGSAKRDQALKDAGCDGIPVKSVHKGGEREGDMTMELVKLEKKNFSASDFDIPAGYTKTEGAMGMPGMKTQQEIMSMTPEERAKYMEEMKKMKGGR